MSAMGTGSEPGRMRSRASAAPSSVLEAVRCPRCAAPIDIRLNAIKCASCGQTYPRLGGIPVLLPDPSEYLASCRRQLTLLSKQVGTTVVDIHEQLGRADVLPGTRVRLTAMIEAIQGQLADVRAIVEPRIPPAEAGAHVARGAAPAMLEYLPYLYRDWGSPADPDGENERALASVEEVLGDRPLGRTLVLGAGACRLAYDLHRGHPDAELAVIDRDPLLFSAAHAVTHGERLTLREANLEVADLDHLTREWVLSAPHGPVDDGRFHFLLADATEPPFAAESFDTVLTPWFIDQGPGDLRDLISILRVVLKPGGRWVNLGPLRYDWEVPVALRFAREELFDLAARAGFRVDRWRSGSAPYLVSRLNGRGRLEWVLSFSATRLDTPAEGPPPDDGPPAWLVFRHLPIPTFAGQSVFWSKSATVGMVVSAIDGKRTLDEIAGLVAERAGQPDITMDQVRVAVRQCLAAVHPACRPDRSG